MAMPTLIFATGTRSADWVANNTHCHPLDKANLFAPMTMVASRHSASGSDVACHSIGDIHGQADKLAALP